jgi:oligopeptide/dipeptide ABC transporter ATP-binding protein
MDELLRLDRITHNYKGLKGDTVVAVRDVSLSVRPMEVLALVGESGSGKTTLGRLAVGLISPSRGKIIFDGSPIDQKHPARVWDRAQYVHQDPYASLDPYLTVHEVLDRPLRYVKKMKGGRERRETILNFLKMIGLDETYLEKRINMLSGGERQRILLLRAFVVGPKFLVADEPTTMVDAIHRGEIVGLLSRFRAETGASILVITHDLSVASLLADKIAIMYKGEIVEYGTKEQLSQSPLHPYTVALLSVTPQKLVQSAQGPLPSVGVVGESVPEDFVGCRYSPFCPYVLERCRRERPVLEQKEGREVACFKYH